VRLAPPAFALLGALALAGCAVAPPRIDARVETVALEAPADEDLVELVSMPGRSTPLALLHQFHEVTGVVLLYDEQTRPDLRERFTWLGTWRGPRSRALDFLRALLATRELVAVPIGPSVAPWGYRIASMNDPSLRTRPIVLEEDEVLAHGDLAGTYVLTVLHVHEDLDRGRARQALSTLTTSTANLGRIHDVEGTRAIVVADWAPLVATMKRALDEINAIAESSAGREKPRAPRGGPASAR
jgi:hypothetical protein